MTSRRRTVGAWGGAALLAGLCAATACEPLVDLNQVPQSKAGCESSTDDLRVAGARMLPGRACNGCHVEGGQAGRFAWTAAGTVYDKPDKTDCNSGGLAGVKVELIDAAGKTVMEMTTNVQGNFYTAEALVGSAFRARVSKDGKSREMATFQATLDCASCHRYPDGLGTEGRIYLR